jgi:hypothetical protein
MEVRGSRISAAAAASLAAAALALAGLTAGCGGAASSTSPASPAVPATPSATPAVSAEPTPVASGRLALEAEAVAIITALGGQAPAGVTPVVTLSDPDSPTSAVHVALGDWQMAWDSKHVLRHVFWEQYAEGDSTPLPGAALTEPEIRARVSALVRALGLQLGEPVELLTQEDAWMADWPRLVDGVPAEENGTRLWLNKDGSFLQYTFGWNDLAPKPAAVITAAEAIAALDDCKVKAGSPAVCAAKLVWHLPSSAALDDPLVLCWVVGPKGGNGDWQVWVDAGTGKIVDVAAELN